MVVEDLVAPDQRQRRIDRRTVSIHRPGATVLCQFRDQVQLIVDEPRTTITVAPPDSLAGGPVTILNRRSVAIRNLHQVIVVVVLVRRASRAARKVTRGVIRKLLGA